MTAPSFLRGYQAQYADDPREACRTWFREARYGLFLHYGLYSLLGRHEWVQCREAIPVAEYAKLADQFTAEEFDAEAIAQFAVDAGMRYVNLTTRHHDSFCLFKTDHTDFQSLNTPCGRDLIGELVEACASRGLGLSLYYSHGRDWKHPHAPNNDKWGGRARPEYDPPEPSYAYGDDNDLDVYLEFMREQIKELLTQYGPLAAIWLDGHSVPASRDLAVWKLQELYDYIHSLQPQVLVSYKQGLLGTEDFYTPEHGLPDTSSSAWHQGKVTTTTGKPLEVCTTMCPGSWGYDASKAGTHLNADQVWEKLTVAGTMGYNLLLNTGPLPDGSLDPEDVEVLLAVGERLRAEGFPGC